MNSSTTLDLAREYDVLAYVWAVELGRPTEAVKLREKAERLRAEQGRPSLATLLEEVR